MTVRYRFATFSLLCAIVFTLIGSLAPQPSAARQSQEFAAPTTNQALISQIQSSTAGQARISYHAETGQVRFIGTDLQHPVARPATLAAPTSPEQAALQFAQTYGQLFGLRDPASELSVMRSQTGDDGRSFVRYQQVHEGIPVLGGELIVQINGAGELLSMNGEALPQLQVAVTPKVSAAAANAAAVAALAKTYKLPSSALVVSDPALWIYNPALLGGPGIRQNTLVWRMEVTAPSSLIPVRELVLVDAQRGLVALHFNQIADAKERHVCDANSIADADGDENNNCDSAGEWVRSEGQGPVASAEVNLAYDYSGITYDYYANRFNRNSIDNLGLPLLSLVRYCPGSCPFGNAFWNGRQMTYGPSYASADDVVGHELTHGVTEFTAGLFYYYQSGAINESLSDVFGELIDFTPGFGGGRGDDTAGSRWMMGEDLPIGAIRDMENPGAFSDPDKTSSADYKGDTSDSGGVHSNSGVNNKAAFLLTDGGTFNGRTITALGETKVGHIYYEALSRLMTSGTDYRDLYDDLRQACAGLVGTFGITSADCQEVKDAVDATEMNLNPGNAPTNSIAVCDTPGNLAINSYLDTMENPASGNWTHSAATGNDEWYNPPLNTPYGDILYATSGRLSLWGNAQGGADDQHTLPPADYSIAMTSNVVVPAGGYLHFNHSYGFEADFIDTYDGGVVEYSTNSGATWQDAGPLFAGGNGYNGTISSGNGNPLAGRNAFVDHSNGYGSSRANLSSLAGQSVRFRFRIGTDALIDDYGWFIDDVRIYRCSAPTEAVFLPLITR
jgi:Zn-dependent metalloprotease